MRLPLYEDMAPWNIVFQGQDLDYIDYDTRDKTFDAYVKKAYQVLSVLMNYKRTVSDFDRCGSKAGNPYNFAFISECVKNTVFSGPCDDPEFPVPCADGHCQSDYITCLRAVVEASSSVSSDSAALPPPDLWGDGQSASSSSSPIATDGEDRFTWNFRK